MRDWDRILKTPYLTVDAVVIDKGTKDGRRGSAFSPAILFVKRKNIPFMGQWALPGGFVERGETLKKAVMREVLEETGLRVTPERVIGVYDDPKRDPIRGHVVTVAFLCKFKGGKLKPQFEEVKETKFFPISEIRKLKIAFDHREIIADALKVDGRPARKVLVGGTFNLVHPGHLYFLKKAKELGDFLVVVIANDKTVLREKGFLLMPAEARKRILESLRIVDKAVIGDERDFLKVVRRERPDIIALGYDQRMENLKEGIEKLGVQCKILRIRSHLGGYKTEKILKGLKSK